MLPSKIDKNYGPEAFNMANSMPTKEHEISKVAIVTGASQGIGRSIALYLAERGWKIWGMTRSIASCQYEHKKIQFLQVSLESDQSIQAAVRHILEKDRQIDALINNAGFMAIGACEETSIERIQQLFEINVLAPIRLAQAILPGMRKHNYGRIINLSSGAAIQAVPGLGAFSASKAALYTFFQAMAAELLPWNIKITSLEIGNVQTPWLSNSLIAPEGEVPEYNNLRQKLQARLNAKNASADEPAIVNGEVVDVLEGYNPPLRKAVGGAMENFLQQHLHDVSGEMYLQQHRYIKNL